MENNRIPFNINLRKDIEDGRYSVETRNGQPARIVCWDIKSNPKNIARPILAVYCDDGDEYVMYYFSDGKARPNDSDYDLFLVPVEQELTEFEKALTGIIEEAIVNKQWHKSIRNDACYLESIARKEIVKEHSTEETELNSLAFLEQLGYTCIPPKENEQPEHSLKESEAECNQQDATAYEMGHRAVIKEPGTFKWSKKDQRNFEAVKRAIVSCTSGVEGVDGNKTQLINWLSVPFRRNYYQNSEYPTIRGWVARDYDGLLYWFCHKPERGYVEWFDKYSRASTSQMIRLNEDDFPTLSWEDEPMEVELVIKPKEESK